MVPEDVAACLLLEEIALFLVLRRNFWHLIKTCDLADDSLLILDLMSMQ